MGFTSSYENTKQGFCHIDQLFPELLKTLSDPSDEVVLLDLEVLAEISASPAGAPHNVSNNTDHSLSTDKLANNRQLNKYFHKFMLDLMAIFRTERKLLEERGSFIIRQLCLLLNAEDIYRALADILLAEKDLLFASLMVKNLNMILLTSSELFDLRHQLKELATKESCGLFCCLYRSWCHNPVSTVSLCLLTQTYKHTCNLLMMFGDLEVNVEFLVQVDKLVQLIESPIFTYLRLQLLETQNNYYLLKSLYGLLMLLLQSDAFNTLRHRLDCVPNGHLLVGQSSQSREAEIERRHNVTQINFKELLEHFKTVQRTHINNKHTRLNLEGQNLILRE